MTNNVPAKRRDSSMDRQSAGSTTPIDDTIIPDPQEASNYLKQTGSLPGPASHEIDPEKSSPIKQSTPVLPSCSSKQTASPLAKRTTRTASFITRTTTPAIAPLQGIPCTFSPNDPENPMNWSSAKKLRCIALGLGYALLTGLEIGLYAASIDYIRTAMSGHPTDTEMRLGISMWVWAVALAPLVIAPFSEVYGRRWFYPITVLVYGLCHLAQVYPRNLSTLLVVRFLSGLFSSVGNTVFAGTCADLYPASSRGWIMATFAFSIFSMNGVSLWLANVIIINLGWQWIGWLLLIACVLLAVGYTFLLPETRGNVILYRRKLRLEKETGKTYYALGEEERMQSWRKLVTGSLTRPILFLFTEPIVASFSAWLAFLWGVQFLLIESVDLVFAEYGFSPLQSSLTFLSILVGASITYLGTFHLQYLYRRDSERAKAKGEKVRPESRLYHAMLGGIGFPIGALIFAWTGRPQFPWIAPCIGLAIIAASIFPAYMAIFAYLADVYETYSSSALACQSLCRNISVGVFVLFASYMYTEFPRPPGTDQSFSYALASTLLAAVGAILGMVPFVLYRFGERLRLRSRVASEIWGAQEEVAHQDKTAGRQSSASQETVTAEQRQEKRKDGPNSV